MAVIIANMIKNNKSKTTLYNSCSRMMYDPRPAPSSTQIVEQVD